MTTEKSQMFYPFDLRHSGISAYVGVPYPWVEVPEVEYKVNWPSIGAVTVAEARQFAATIIKACNWLDAQKEAESKQPVIATSADIDVPGDRREL